MEDSEVAAALSAQLAERIGLKRFDLWFQSQAQVVRGGNATDDSRAECVRARLAADALCGRHS